MTRSFLKQRDPYTRQRARYWGDDAACKSHDAREEGDIFFPPSYAGLDLLVVNVAKEFCQGCPVRGECLDHAIKTGERVGVWGGLTPEERVDLARRGSGSAAA